MIICRPTKRNTMNIKNILVIATFIAFTISITTSSKAEIDEPDMAVVLLDDSTASQTQNTDVYQLFPTQNSYNFLKLNTRTGQIWIVQFDIGGDNRGTSSLNIFPLVSEDNEVNGRFTLYPTKNFYTFILLDQISGKTWQVQWGFKFEDYLIIPIE